MADRNATFCDNCGIEKKEVNHWWVIDANAKTKSMFIIPLENAGNVFGRNYIRIKACGLECLAKLESKIKEGVNPLK